MSEKEWKQVVTSQYFESSHFFEDRKSQIPWSALRTTLQRKLMSQSTEMTPLVSLLFGCS